MSPTNDPGVNDALGGLLNSLLAGHPAVQGQMQKTGSTADQVLGSLSQNTRAGGQQSGGMGDLLGALMGGGPSGGAPSSSGGGDMLGSLLGSMLGGGQAPSQSAPAQITKPTKPSSGRPKKPTKPKPTQSSQPAPSVGGDLLGSLLGSALGGGGQMPSQGMSNQGMPSGGGSMLGSLLGSMLGGGGQMPGQGMPSGGADPLGGLLGSLLGVNTGGGASAIANNPISNALVAPIADALSKKTGMAPGIAQVVVVFAMQALLSAATQQGSQKGFNASDLVNKLATDGTVSQKYLADSGLVDQLAQQSGLDKQTAARSLQQTFAALGTQVGGGTMQERQQNMQKVLKQWK